MLPMFPRQSDRSRYITPKNTLKVCSVECVLCRFVFAADGIVFAPVDNATNVTEADKESIFRVLEMCVAQPSDYWAADPELVRADLRRLGLESDSPTAPLVLRPHESQRVAIRASIDSAAGCFATRFVRTRMSGPRRSLASTQQAGAASRIWTEGTAFPSINGAEGVRRQDSSEGKSKDGREEIQESSSEEEVEEDSDEEEDWELIAELQGTQ